MTKFIGRGLALAIAGFVLVACTSEGPSNTARQTAASTGDGLTIYPIVGRFGDSGDTVIGASVDNLIEGTYPLRARSRQSGVTCEISANAPPLSTSVGRCAGQQGLVQFSCDNGRTVDVTWQAESCSAGYGYALDAQGSRFDFSFGMPRLVAMERFSEEAGNDQPQLATVVTAPESPAVDPLEGAIGSDTQTGIGQTGIGQSATAGGTVQNPQTGTIVATAPAAQPPVSEQQSAADFWDSFTLVGNGTGFFVTPNGHLLTNHHVVEDADFVVVRLGEDYHEATIQDLDSNNDLALLKIDAVTKPLPLPSSPSYQRGGEVMTLGYPFGPLTGYSQKATFGRINDLRGLHDDPRLLQMDVPIQPGNSGGPLFNTKGEVIGIVASKINDAAILDLAGTVPQNMNFAVKADYALPLLGTLKSAVTPAGAESELSFADLSQIYEQSVVLVLTFDRADQP